MKQENQQSNQMHQKSKYLSRGLRRQPENGDKKPYRPGDIPDEIMADLKPPFVPTYLWFAKVVGAVLISLIILFFVGNAILKPYMIKSPIEITPWLDDSKPKTSILGV